VQVMSWCASAGTECGWLELEARGRGGGAGPAGGCGRYVPVAARGAPRLSAHAGAR